jgi:hypothetical protein
MLQAKCCAHRSVVEVGLDRPAHFILKEDVRRAEKVELLRERERVSTEH